MGVVIDIGIDEGVSYAARMTSLIVALPNWLHESSEKTEWVALISLH